MTAGAELHEHMRAARKALAGLGVAPRVLHFVPHAHSAVHVTYRAQAPCAGTVIGVHIPREWPALTTLDSAAWVGGETVVVPSNGRVPARGARMLRFWCAGEHVLEVRLGVACSPGFAQRAVNERAALRPFALLAPAVQSGAQRSDTWKQGQMSPESRTA